MKARAVSYNVSQQRQRAPTSASSSRCGLTRPSLRPSSSSLLCKSALIVGNNIRKSNCSLAKPKPSPLFTTFKSSLSLSLKTPSVLTRSHLVPFNPLRSASSISPKRFRPWGRNPKRDPKETDKEKKDEKEQRESKSQGTGQVINESVSRKPRFGLPDPFIPPEVKRHVSEIFTSIVKLHVVSSSPDHSMPWQKNDSEESSGSGCVIDGPFGMQFIITNSHVVENHTFVKVQKQGSGQTYIGEVFHQSEACDLALVRVKDKTFFDGLKSLKFTDLPNLQDSVLVLGYPEGGDSISITKGIVSRLEIGHYNEGSFQADQTGTRLLSIQIDAAINPGNSGGPAVNEDNEIIGIVFSKLGWSENVGYLIPSEVVNHFITELWGVRRPNFCAAVFQVQGCENESLRKFYSMEPDQTGILVTGVDPLSSASGELEKGDIILSIDSVRIGNDGTISAKEAGIEGTQHLRLTFDYLFTRRMKGQPIDIEVLRMGIPIKLTIENDTKKYLIPLVDTIPSYFICGGLVFVPLTEKYLAEFEQSPFEGRFYYDNIQKNPDEEIVLLLKVLTDEVNLGYSAYEGEQVTHFNDEPVKNLFQLAYLMKNTKFDDTDFLKFDLESGHTMIVEVGRARKAEKRIKKRYEVSSFKSKDLRITFALDRLGEEQESSKGLLQSVKDRFKALMGQGPASPGAAAASTVDGALEANEQLIEELRSRVRPDQNEDANEKEDSEALEEWLDERDGKDENEDEDEDENEDEDEKDNEDKAEDEEEDDKKKDEEEDDEKTEEEKRRERRRRKTG